MAAVAVCKATVSKSMKKCTHKTKNGTDYCGYHKKFVVSQNATTSSSPPPPPPESNECAICLMNITPDSMKRTECNHTFHSECLKKWTTRKNTCPCCRATLHAPPITERYRQYRIALPDMALRVRSSALINGIENHLISWAMRFSLSELNQMRDLYPNDSSEYRRYTEVIEIRNREDALNAMY